MTITTALLLLAGVPLTIWGLYHALVFIGVRGILRSYRRTPKRVEREMGYHRPEDFKLRYDRLAVEVEPGLVLRGWLFRTDRPRRGVLVYHHGIWDAAAPRLPLAARMQPCGLDVVFYDSRGHGSSDGCYCTYGEKEKHDLLRVLDAVEARGVRTERVAVVGHSMGAATAVYAARLDARIRALVLEACYLDLPTAVSDYARLIIPFLPAAIIRRALRAAAQKGGFHPEELSPLAAMPDLKMPVLFVQGTADRRIKPDYVRAHYRAKPEPKELLYIEAAGHGRVWHQGGDPYMQKLTDWLCVQMPVLD